MDYAEVIKRLDESQSSDKVAKSLTRRVLLEFDRRHISLEKLTLKEYAEIVLCSSRQAKSLSFSTARRAVVAIRWIYSETGISMPEEIQTISWQKILNLALEENDCTALLRDTEEFLKQLNEVPLGQYYLAAKVAYILAWHGVSCAEMSGIKKEDIDVDRKFVKASQIKRFLATPEEMNLIIQYMQLQEYETPAKKKVSLEDSKYLFRPRRIKKDGTEEYPERMSEQAISSVARKFCEEMNKQGVPLGALTQIQTNGDFYRAFLGGFSKTLFDPMRAQQYDRYIQKFWS